MKLLGFGETRQEKPGLIDQNGIARDISGFVPEIGCSTLSDTGLSAIRSIETEEFPVVPEGTCLGPCLGNVGKFICVGLNYADHAAESGLAVPAEPVLLMKATSSIMGPNDAVRIPVGSKGPTGRSSWG